MYNSKLKCQYLTRTEIHLICSMSALIRLRYQRNGGAAKSGKGKELKIECSRAASDELHGGGFD